MWIFKTSNEFLKTLSSRSKYACNSITTFYFSASYTTIPHTQLKYRIKELILYCFSQKNGNKDISILQRKVLLYQRHSKFILKNLVWCKTDIIIVASKCNLFLLLVETNLTLSKNIQNLININRTRSFKC